MPNNNINHKNHTTEPTNGEVKGRTYNSQHPDVDRAASNADISAVDQQEGSMNPGETGADNLSQGEKEGSSDDKA